VSAARETCVCLVGIDGLRVDDALGSGRMPVLSELVEGGSFVGLTMEVPTISGPGWTSILTGATHAQHRVVDNTFRGGRTAFHADFLAQAWFADQEVTTAAAVSWPPIADPRGPGPIIWWREEAQRQGRHRIFVRDGETSGYDAADGEVVAWTRALYREAAPRAAFVYLGEVDMAAHAYGALGPECRDAQARVDARLGIVVDALREAARTTGRDVVVGVTTDHGHLDEGGHGGAESIVRRSFFAAQHLVPDQGTVRPMPPAMALPGTPADIASWLLASLRG
jgi:predicted AlkP superfamily pyrophosphatase or phosphodiesterase